MRDHRELPVGSSVPAAWQASLAMTFLIERNTHTHTVEVLLENNQLHDSEEPDIGKENKTKPPYISTFLFPFIIAASVGLCVWIQSYSIPGKTKPPPGLAASAC